MSAASHDRGRLAWRLILVAVGLQLLAAVAGGLRGDSPTSALPALMGGLALVAAWILVVRFVFLDTWGRWLFLAAIVLTGALAAAGGNGGVIGGATLAGIALVTRTLRAWRLVSARQRALGFGLGMVSLAALAMAGGFRSGDVAGFGAFLRDLGTWSLASLAVFWVWSMFNLAVRMRLHFLRLRPKLTIAALLIGLVPLVVIILLGGMTVYGTLGGARAARAGRLLESWRAATASGADLAPVVFDTTFAWPSHRSATAPEDRTVLPTPAWPDEIAPHLAAPDSVTPDTTDWFLAEGDVWLVRWRGLGTPEAAADAWLLGEKPLRRMSEILHAGVVVRFMGAENRDGAIVINADQDESEEVPRYRTRHVVYRDVSADPDFWSDWRFFGSYMLRTQRMGTSELGDTVGFVGIKVGWRDLWDEFGRGELNLNLVVVVVLGFAVLLFLVIEAFAVFFGVRISEGIVAAVHALHRGTRAVAAGDLDTEISIPNEDEIGDLAGSFNEMIRAVRQGREDALARERLTRELETARTIQERLLPDAPPELAGFEVAGTSIPSREIGGDYFDFLLQEDGRIGLAIADVSGKGMPAALLMANLQASLHGQVIHPSSVSEVVARVNELLVSSTDPHMFATFFYGVLDPATAVLTCTNAGHNPPLVLRADGEFAELQLGGLLLGMMPGQEYRQEQVELQPGEVVVLFTDGITEAVGPSAVEDDPEAMFGEEALREVVRRHAHLPAVGIKEAILAAVAEHTAGVEQSDDITLVVVRCQG